MTVGNFSEVIGTDGFDSIRGEDLSVVYALDDRDALTSSISDDERTTISVGGSGDNDYVIFRDSTTFILENGDSDNILWTNIGTSGISLEDDDSFVAEIDERHLYLGNTETNQNIVVVDWQLPENQIEAFALSEGILGYSEFVDSFDSSSNYRGNFTWAELADTEEIEPIDLDRLGLSPKTIDDDFETINDRSLELSFMVSNPLSTFINEAIADENDNDFLYGDVDDNVLRGTVGRDAIFGGGGDDRISGNYNDDIIVGGIIGEDADETIGTGGSDTLLGGYGNDAYYVSLSAGDGSVVRDEIDPDDTDVLFIIAEDTNIDSLLNADAADDSDAGNIFATNEYWELVTDPTTFGDSAIEITLPEEDIVGIEKSGTSLIIDINRDGIAEAQDDLTIVDFFDEDGELGNGSMAQINNIVDTQAIADFF